MLSNAHRCGASGCWRDLPRATEKGRKERAAAFLGGLKQLGWIEGRNIRVDIRWAAFDPERMRKEAEELVALAPDVILAHANAAVGALRQATRTVPIVFPVAGDPVATGFVDSMARPGGNITGFMQFEFALSGKWLELLKQIGPDVTRAAVLRDPTMGTGTSQFAAIQAVAPSLRVDVKPVNASGEAGEIELLEAHIGLRMRRTNPPDRVLAALRISGCDYDFSSSGGKRGARVITQPIIGAGDDGELATLGRYVVDGPRHGRPFFLATRAGLIDHPNLSPGQAELIGHLDLSPGQAELSNGAGCRTRTDDLPLTRRLLYQLS